MFNTGSNIWPDIAPLRDIAAENVNDFENDLSLSLKVKFNSNIGLPIYDMLLMEI